MTNTNELELIEALLAVQALLVDWPTMRALSAVGAEKATANKLAARKIVADALDAANSASLRRQRERDALQSFWQDNQHLNYGEARAAMAARDAEAAGPFPVGEA